MRFFVNFVNINGEPLTSDIGKPGIDFIDSFREEYPQYNHVKLEDILYYSNCPISYDSYTVNISEDLARETGLYGGKTEVDVEVNFEFSAFVRMKVVVKVDYDYVSKKFLFFPYTKKVNYDTICVNNVVDNNAILNAWKNAGYPLKWYK